MKLFAGLMRIDECMKYGYFVNGKSGNLMSIGLQALLKFSKFQPDFAVNFGAETLINMMRPVLGPFVDKFEIGGTQMAKWKPLIMRKISIDQVPAQFGGTWSSNSTN